MDPDKTLLTIGKVTGVHGLSGNLKVWSFADSIDTFARGRQVWLKSEMDRKKTAYTIRKSAPRKKGVLLILDQVDNREQAEALVGKEILISREQLPELDKETWYWQDLYGMTVVDQERGVIGVVDQIFPTPAHDLLVVMDQGEETLIPMHERFVASVDLEKKVIRTTLPPGL